MSKLHVFTKRGSAHKSEQEMRSRLTSGLGLERGIKKLEERRSQKESVRQKGELKTQRARAWTEKLLLRVFSGVLYSVAVVSCIYADPTSTAFAIAAMAWLCCSEFFHMIKLAHYNPYDFVGLFVALLFPILALFNSYTLLLSTAILYALVLSVLYIASPHVTIADTALSFFAPMYTSLLFSHIVLLRCSQPNFSAAVLTLVVMCSVWANDISAYFVGCNFGKHPLAPTISPHKSIEGFYGGLAASVAVWFCIYYFGLVHISLGYALICGLVVGIVSVIGDLFESRIKRSVHLKDSGTIMPGHGGLLDRSDSMLFGCTAAYFLLVLGGLI